MTGLDALAELLERLGAAHGAPVMVNEEELLQWPQDAIAAMKAQKLLTRAAPATSIVCPGCEQQCTMPVHTLPAGKPQAASFIMCDKRDDINRVAVPAEQLRQWRCHTEDVSAFVAQSLGMRPGSLRKTMARLWELGLLAGNRRSQMLCLRINDQLELVAGSNAIHLAELVSFGSEGFAVDGSAARRLVDASTTGDSRHTPSNARREVRKLETRVRHGSWQKAYRALVKSRPGMSGRWYSQKIAGMPVADGKSAETIRKHMTR